MTQIGIPVLALIMLCTIGLLSSEAAAARRPACCTMYSSMRVARSAIKGFTIQKDNGKCNINAVIVHTTRDKKICVDPELAWVTDMITYMKAQIQGLRVKRPRTQ